MQRQRLPALIGQILSKKTVRNLQIVSSVYKRVSGQRRKEREEKETGLLERISDLGLTLQKQAVLSAPLQQAAIDIKRIIKNEDSDKISSRVRKFRVSLGNFSWPSF